MAESRDRLYPVSLGLGFVSLSFVVLIVIGFLNFLPADFASILMLLGLICAPVFSLLAIGTALVDFLIYKLKRTYPKPHLKPALLLGSSGILAVGALLIIFELLSRTTQVPW